MTDDRAQYLAEARKGDSDIAHFEITRVKHEEGRTFSAEALEGVTDALTLWLAGRVLARWDRTTTPPQWLRLTVVLTWGEDEEVHV